MNKTQINWCEKRIGVIKDRKISELEELNQQIKPLSYADKAAQIISGKAKFKIERFLDEDSCPHRMGYVSEMFEFEGQAEITAKNEEIKLKISRIKKIIEKDAELLFDRFVLGEITEAKALEEFSNKIYSV